MAWQAGRSCDAQTALRCSASGRTRQTSRVSRRSAAIRFWRPRPSKAQSLPRDWRPFCEGEGVTPNNKKCGLRPGVALRMWRGEQAVDVLVCFECDTLWAYVVGSQVEKPHYQWHNFDPVRGELLALAKEALPDDVAIQKLADRK